MKADVAIVGAGPAGIAAADIVAKCGMDVVVIDEQRRAGGQILRQPPASFQVERWLADRIYQPQHRLLERAEQSPSLRWQLRTTVLGIDTLGQRPTLQLTGPEGAFELEAERVLVAPGCRDLPVTFPGALLPGVMATGGIQAFVKSQQIVPGDRFVFSGSHPLQLIVADQVARAGGDVAAVYFSQPREVFWRALHRGPAMLRYPVKMRYLLAAYGRLLRRGVPVRFGGVARQAIGDGRLEKAVIGPSARPWDTPLAQIDCDRLGIGFGFLANSELALQAGARGRWSDRDGGWLVTADEWMRSSLPRLYVAGEITGMGGADISQREGELAGLGIALDAGRIAPDNARARAQPVRRALRPLRRFAKVLNELSYPGATLLGALIREESIICKCEEVTAGDIRGLSEQAPHPPGVNSIKLLSRCGMGLCQGRYCQHALRTLLVSDGIGTVDDTEGFTARFPVKPATIGALAALPESREVNEDR